VVDFSVQFGMPRNGWMLINLSKEDAELAIAASYIFHEDAPMELVRSLSNVLLKKPLASVIWFLGRSEPDSCHFEFKTENDKTVFQVNEPKPHGKVETHFELEMPSFELVLVFWRGLRCLQSQILHNDFQEGWHFPFPEKELDKLTEQLREIKRKQQ
jgi:hypothetical protein